MGLEAAHCYIGNLRKSPRVARSIVVAQLLVLNNCFDAGYGSQDLVLKLLGQTVPLKLYTDPHITWDAVTSPCSTTEKRLLKDTLASREAYRAGDMANTARIATADNPADAQTNFPHHLASDRSSRRTCSSTASNRPSHMANWSLSVRVVTDCGPKVRCQTMTLLWGPEGESFVPIGTLSQ